MRSDVKMPLLASMLYYITVGMAHRMIILQAEALGGKDIVGIVVGAVSGLILGNQMLSFLEFTETGTRVEPPFILQTDWIMVGIGVGVILLVFVLALVAARGFLARNSDSTALRTE